MWRAIEILRLRLKGFTMYEELKLQILHLDQEDVVRTSGESDWYDDNVDDGGWI